MHIIKLDRPSDNFDVYLDMDSGILYHDHPQSGKLRVHVASRDQYYQGANRLALLGVLESEVMLDASTFQTSDRTEEGQVASTWIVSSASGRDVVEMFRELAAIHYTSLYDAGRTHNTYRLDCAPDDTKAVDARIVQLQRIHKTLQAYNRSELQQVVRWWDVVQYYITESGPPMYVVGVRVDDEIERPFRAGNGLILRGPIDQMKAHGHLWHAIKFAERLYG